MNYISWYPSWLPLAFLGLPEQKTSLNQILIGSQYISFTVENKQTYHLLNVNAKPPPYVLQFTILPQMELRWGKEGEQKKTFKQFPENWLQFLILFHSEHNLRSSKFNFLPYRFYLPWICSFPFSTIRQKKEEKINIKWHMVYIKRAPRSEYLTWQFKEILEERLSPLPWLRV